MTLNLDYYFFIKISFLKTNTNNFQTNKKKIRKFEAEKTCHQSQIHTRKFSFAKYSAIGK